MQVSLGFKSEIILITDSIGAGRSVGNYVGLIELCMPRSTRIVRNLEPWHRFGVRST